HRPPPRRGRLPPRRLESRAAHPAERAPGPRPRRAGGPLGSQHRCPAERFFPGCLRRAAPPHPLIFSPNIPPVLKYIEPHAHMVSRTTDDYEKLALAGCEALCEPAFWAGFDRSSADGFHDYFRQLTEYEPKRAAKFGIKHFSWLCINPKEADDPGFAR